MKSVDDLILALRNKHIKLRVEAENLAIDAPKGVLNAQIVEELRVHKASIIALLRANDMAQAVKIPRPIVDAQPPLSFAQQRLWFIDRLEGASSAYHISGAVRLIGGLDRVALRLTLDTLIERHESLRTRFGEVEGSAVQIISAASRFALEEVDIRGLDASKREEEVTRCVVETVSVPFDLSVGPLIRGCLLRVADQEHVLLLTMHHIVSDGWSLGILVREVGVLYSAYREGQPNPLVALPIQYADYAQWQRQWLVGDRLQAQLTYWQAQLSGAPALLELPTDRVRPVVQSYAGGSVEFALGMTLCGQLKAFSRQHDVTLFMTLYAGFSILLSRLSGQADLVIGTAVANRQRTEVEGLIGFFVNTLALRVQLSDALTVRDLLQEVREMTLAGYSHQETPFEQVVEVVRPPRSLSHSPIFQVLFALQNTPQSEAQLPGLTLAPQAMPQTTAQYDLSLSLQEVGEELVGSFNYASDLFDRATLERWVGYFKTVLAGMVVAAEGSVGDIELLSAGERQQLIRGFNDTHVEYPQDPLIHELFEAQVEKTPKAIAVVYETDQLTYEQLNGKANQLAHYLRAQGVQPDSLVGLCVERSVEMVVGILGILKAGGAYVPLDPSYPSERLEYMLKDAAPGVVLTQARLKASLPAIAAKIIRLDSEWSEIAGYESSDLDPAALQLRPNHLAYVIYTSGSTGQPKGVMVEHRELVASTAARLTYYSQMHTMLLIPSFAFDTSTAVIFWALTSSAKLLLIRDEQARDPAALATIVNRYQVDLWVSGPSLYDITLSFGGNKRLASLRTIVVGGETLNHSIFSRHKAEMPATSRFYNEYGPTEATVWCSVDEVSILGEADYRSIGRPISNTQIYILDNHGEPVPMGVSGELYIGGAGVARGYLNRAELTAERFVRDPFSTDPTARMYKTGDVGRWRADGNIEYLGRNDHQVKIRGFRIELGEIESQLTRHAQVKEAVVLAREDSPGEKRLIAYLTSRDAAEGAPSMDALRSHLKEVLPEYMIPSAFVLLEKLPLTPNGKIDRKALPAPEREAYAVQAYEAPQGEIEEALAGIWQELLQIERVGRQDNFFELGGHSLLIVQLIERLRQGGMSAELRTVFTSPTLQALANTLKSEVAATFIVPPNLIPAGCTAITPAMLTLVQLTTEEIERIVHTVPGGAANVQDIYPLVPLQEGVLFHHLLHESSDPYVLPILLAVKSRAQLDAFLGALQAVIDRHDILRSAVLWKELPRPIQVVYRHASLSVQALELDAARPTLEQLKERMAPERQWMDLQQAPLIRVQTARDAHSSQWYVLLQQHHLIGDHVGQEIILSEMFAQLTGQVERLSAPLAYRGFVAQALAYAEQNDAETYFRATLGTIEEATAPFGLLDVQGDGSRIAEAHQAMEAGLARRVRACARQLSMSTATLFHAAWALVVAKTSGREEVVFGSVLSGRLQGTVGADRLLGMFINTLPLRLQLKALSVRQLVEHTQQELVELLKYEQASLAVAQRCSGMGGGAPLFSAVLNYRHSAPMPETSADPAAALGIEVLAGQERTNYPLAVSVDDLGVGFAVTVQVDRRLEASRVTAYVHAAMESLIQALESAPDTGALTLGVLPKAERQQLIRGFNDTHVEYPHDPLIHELFEAQVQRTPQAIAVVYEEESLSYAELNRRANQLAHYLRAQGVQADSLVGICVERSVEMVVGILGILKAGGAYVPLDPSYPRERLEYMLKDAAPGVVLTQARLKESLPAIAAKIIRLDSEWSEIAGYESSDLDPAALQLTPNHLAYVIYTSGSTGQPKGVMNEHGAVINRLHWMQEQYRLDPSDRVLQKTPFSFDVSVWEFFWPLLNGVRLIVARPQGHQDPGYLSDLIHASGITVVHFVPSMLQVFLEQGALAQCKTLRHVVCSGEELSVALQTKCLDGLPQAQLHNLYGPTEAAIDVTYWECSRDAELSRVPIGRPISNTQIYILDSHGEPAPMRVSGEIYIGGAGVARGYLNRAELTAERFVRDPFSTNPTARMYKTGDVGRWRVDGNIEYLGRNDHQVKIRGFRIELGEIESQLSRHSQIKEAVVLAREDSPGEKRLVAYLTSKEAAEGAPSVDALRVHLKEVVPEYMIPSAFVLLEKLPLTPNGKIDRKSLPAPERDAYAVQAYEAPQGEIEEALAGIWQELLHVERVGRQDNFFELGGHSLLAMQLLGRIRTVLKLELPLRTLFEYPVLHDLQKQLATQHLVTWMPIKRADRSQALPLSWSQQRLWFIAQLEGAGEAYHIPGAVRLQGELDPAALQQALAMIVERHEVLRTYFTQVGGSPIQVINEEVKFALPIIDLRQHPPMERDAQVQQHVVETVSVPFDLSVGPLIRGRLLRVADQEHVLLLTMHHIVSDGWSLGILVREVGVLYSAYREGRANPLTALPIQYADYAQWQRQWLVGDRLQAQLTYWQAQLSGAPALLELPTDRVRPLVQSYAGESVEFALGPTLGGQLKAFSRQHDVTLFMTLYAGFALLLSRLSGQSDIVMGTAVANRQRTEVEGLIGFFVNTLALRVQLSESLTVSELLTQVREMTLAGYSHQETPFEQVVEVVRPPRSLSHSPIFQVLFALQNTPQSEVGLPGLTLAPQALPQTTAQYDLSLSLQAIGEELVGSFNYASDLFDRATIERWVGHFKAVLAGMVVAAEGSVGDIELLSTRERQQLIRGFNDTHVEYPHDPLIHELFEAQVQRTPQAIAVVYEEESLSYAELNRRTNQLAHYLRAQGVQADSLVGICVERSVEMVVGILGILKAGGAYVPLDPSYPRERLEYMLKDAAPGVLLTQARLKSSLPATSARLIGLDSEWNEIAGYERSDLDPAALQLRPNHLAYVIYTSGSTGQPKGVMNEHRAVINRLHWMQEQYRLDPSDRVLQKTPFSFDVSVWEFFWPLLNGVRLIVARPQGHQDPGYLSDLIHTSGITVVHFVPSMLQVFLEQGALAQCKTLRHVVCSGEELSVVLQTKFLNCLPQAQLHNLYGPTEAAIDVTYWECHRDAELSRVPIGRPISNTQIYILDSHGEPVPMGVSGEIYIGGTGVARGYLNRPALTAERFVRDPFSTDPAARMYKTGDLGRWRVDGNIEYLGRNDHQVKIRGFRIELGEIESQLTRHPHVNEAVVLAREDSPGEKRLVAYLTSKEAAEGAPSVDALRAHLKEVVPEYMIPSAFVLLEQLPLTPNGKIDRKALPAPERDAYAVRVYEAPQGEIEEALAGIWQELLHVERVGRQDNFFELGGHSLLAMQLLGRIRTVLKLELPLRTLFEYPVLHDLQKQLATQHLVTWMPIERADRRQALALSYSQQRLWFIAQLEGAGEAYHIPGAVRLQGELDAAALQQALATIIERHEVLRTSFTQLGGSPIQVINEEVKFALPIIDLRQHPPMERDAKVQHHVVETVSVPFDLSVGPLIRGCLLRVADQEHVLLLTMHHIVSDGWSLGILVREVGVLYSAYREGQPNPLVALPIQYADYAQWQRQWLVGDRLQAQLTYWQAQLSGAPALLELPTDRVRPLVQSYAGGSVEFALGMTLCGQLKAFSRQHDVTLFMTLYAGFSILLSRLSGQADLVIGTAVANRQRTEVEGLIGFFVNTLALRVQLSDALTVRDLLQEVREMTLAGYSHQETPFEQVVEVVRPPRSLSHSPIFQVLFALQNTPQSEAQLPGLTFAPQEMPQTTAQYDLSLSLQEIGEELVGSFNYASDLFDRATIERWVGHFQAVLAGMVRDAEQIVGIIPLLGDGERQQLIKEFNDTHVEYPHDQLIHELFEAQVEKTPTAVAVVYEEESLSYAELNRRANQLAHYLREQGVQADSLVGLCVERSVEMVVGILGILKAGGAYVPLDPSYPSERLEYMLKDAAPRVVLTQARLKASLPAIAAQIISLDSEWSEMAGYESSDLDPAALQLRPNHLAYVIYTSGSTGQPKGVMVEHRGLCNLAMAQITAFEVKPDSRVLQFASLSFDACISEIAMTLGVGARLMLASRMDLMPGEPLQTLLSRHQISHATLPPVAASSLRFSKELESTLTTLIVAGEACSSGLTQQWAQRLRFINAYGPTEATVCASIYVCDSQTIGAPPIGRPISNTQIYILDSHGEPVPMGVSGELYIGGAGVARGYLNRAALTAERFVRDPFSQETTARMYKTGDLGRWRVDGNIEYLGRNDHQVKIRGFRIELGEIESQLTRHPHVNEAVVLAREDRPGEKRLVAYLTSGDEAPSVEALRSHLKGALPEYMIPSAFVPLEQLPLTPNGKIDRKALPAPELEAYAVQAYEAPQGEIEEALVSLWQELLQVERVGRYDNFFELGGHSLLVLEFISRVQTRGFNVSLRAVFDYPTIKALGAYLKNGADIHSTNDNLITLKRGGSSRPLFLIHAIDGGVLAYVPLVRLLNDSVPVHALQMTEMNNSALIQQLATKYLEIIQRTQSHGPYKLAGWSMGALVAYEMAHQLLNIGESVEFVGLIDPIIQIARPPDTHQSDELADVSLLLSWLESYAPTMDQATLLELRGLDKVHLILDRCQQTGNLPMTFSLSDLQTRIQNYRVLADACASYSPMRLPITSHFFLAKNKLPTYLSRDPTLFAGDKALKVIIGGTHQTMMNPPHVERLADAINKSLGELEESQFSSA